MDRYDMLHSDLYVEPTDDVGVGSIHPPAAAEATVLNVEPTRKKLKQKNDATGSKDIRSFFSFTTKQNAQEGRVENTKKNNPRKKTVVISDDSESESETSDVNISFSSDDDDLNDMSLPGIPDLDLNSDDSDTYWITLAGDGGVFYLWQAISRQTLGKLEGLLFFFADF